VGNGRVTSYYDELILRRAGYISEQEYLQKFNGTLNYLEASEGRKVQPVAHARDRKSVV
jgi:predicted metalloprotease with PDZ domain